MAEKDFTFNIKINGRDELDETIKEMKQFVQTLKEAQELIEYLSRKCGYDVKDIAGRLADELESVCREVSDEIQKKRERKRN